MSPKEIKRKAQVAALKVKGATVILNSVPRATDEGWLPLDAVHDGDHAMLRRLRPLVSSRDGNIFAVANPSVSAVGFAKELSENPRERQPEFFEPAEETVARAVEQRFATTQLVKTSGDAIEKLITGEIQDLEGLETFASVQDVRCDEVLKHIADARGKVMEVQSGANYFTIGGKGEALKTKLLSAERFVATGAVRGFDLDNPMGTTASLRLRFLSSDQNQSLPEVSPRSVEVLIDTMDAHSTLQLLLSSWQFGEGVELTLARAAHFASRWTGFAITEVRAGKKALALRSSISEY